MPDESIGREATSMSELRYDEQLDLRGVICPINFVQTKLKLEEMDEGQILEVVLDDGDPIRNVPRSIKEDGHKIIGVQRQEDDTYKLLIRKVGE